MQRGVMFNVVALAECLVSLAHHPTQRSIVPAEPFLTMPVAPTVTLQHGTDQLRSHCQGPGAICDRVQWARAAATE